MTLKINIHEAKTHFPKLLARVGEGEGVVIARAGKPVARLIPVSKKPKQRVLGSAKDKIAIGKDFDKPLPASILNKFNK